MKRCPRCGSVMKKGFRSCQDCGYEVDLDIRIIDIFDNTKEALVDAVSMLKGD